MYPIYREIFLAIVIPHIARLCSDFLVDIILIIGNFNNPLDEIKWYSVIKHSISFITVYIFLFLMALRFTRRINESPNFSDFWHFNFSKYWYSGAVIIGFALGCFYYFGMSALIREEPYPLHTVLVFGFLYTVIAPIPEELFFRGICYNIFRRYLGILPSMVISSFLFTIWHPQVFFYNYIVAIPIFLIGSLQCLIIEKIQSIIPLIIIHAVCNFIIWFLKDTL